MGDVVPQRRVGAEGAVDEVGDAQLMLGAEALRGCGEPGGCLFEHLAEHEDAPDAVADLELGDLLAHHRVGTVGSGSRNAIESPVGHQPVDATAFVFQLAHRLLERRALGSDEVDHRDAHVGEEHLAEVTVGGHVGDRADLDAGAVHRHDDLGDPRVRRAVVAGAADQVAVVGHGAEAGPDLLAVDHPVVAIADRLGLQRGEVAAGVRFAHADAPRGLAGQDLRQELGLLVGAAVGDQRRTHLAVGEPHAGDRGAGLDQLLADDQPLDRRAAAATELGRPGHPDPAVGGQLAGELLRVAVDPRVVRPTQSSNRIGGDETRTFAQRLLVRRPVEVHRGRW